MTEILNWIMDLIRVYGAWIVFIGVIIESVIIPIPSPLVIMGAGLILINSDLTAVRALIPILLLIVVPGSFTSTLGAYIGYGIGFFGGKPVVQWWKGFFGFSWEDVDILQKMLRGGQVKMTIFLLRAVPIIPLSLISMAADFVRLSITPFTLWTFYGSVLRCLILGYLGWGISETYHGLARGIDRVETVVSLFIILAILGEIIWLRGKIGISLLKK